VSAIFKHLIELDCVAALFIFVVDFVLDDTAENIDDIIPTITTLKSPTHCSGCHISVAISEDLRIFLTQVFV
jgi:hypothetical protein